MSAITESQASAKRCQEAYAACTGVSMGGSTQAVAHYYYAGSAYQASFTAPMMCIGSQCMAWRWHYHVKRHIEKGNSDTSEGGPATGYCGKAGKP